MHDDPRLNRMCPSASTPGEPNGCWFEYHVIESLKELKADVAEMRRKQEDASTAITDLKATSRNWGAAAGIAGALVVGWVSKKLGIS
jgi:hypothetical protein